MGTEVHTRLGLAEAIREVRAQLSRARQEGEGQDVRFTASQIELELSLDFGWSVEASGGVSKWIPFVDLSAKGGTNEKSVHKIKLTLELATEGTPADRLVGSNVDPFPPKSAALKGK